MKLIELRKSKNINQMDIAKALGIRQSTYCMIEHGQRKLSVEYAKKLGEIFGIEWWKLFEEA